MFPPRPRSNWWTSPRRSSICWWRRERPDIVNHHAAQTSVTASARDPGLDARANCVGLLNVLRSCVRHRVGRFVMISSGGAIYGEASRRPTPEDETPQPLSPYAIHKLAGEHYLEFYRREHGLSSVTLRYGNVYGPRQDPYGEAGVGRHLRRQAAARGAARGLRLPR